MITLPKFTSKYRPSSVIDGEDCAINVPVIEQGLLIEDKMTMAGEAAAYQDKNPPEEAMRETLDTKVKGYRDPPVYSIEEIRKHDNPQDLWMIIYNKVYNITNFSQDHPGGAEVLFDCGGIDATEPFEDVGHLEHALNMLHPYYIGDLDYKYCVKYEILKKPKSKRQLKLDSKLKRNKIKKRNKLNKIIEHVSVIFLILLILITLLFYIHLQKSKWQ